MQKNDILNTVTSFLHHKMQKIYTNTTANEYRMACRLATAAKLTFEEKETLNDAKTRGLNTK